MEQKVIVKNENLCIYYMKETNLGFYLLIPNSRQVKITLGLFEEVTADFIKSIPTQNDKAVVIPVIQSDILRQANLNEPTSYNYLNQVLSFLINTSYKILTYNHIEVDNQILLNQSPKLNLFEQSFIAKYQGRVQLTKLFPEVPTTVVSPVSTPIEQPQPVTETPLQTNIENVMPTELPSDKPEESIPSKKETHEPGFVSYVLLGVVVAVVSLVFLYLII